MSIFQNRLLSLKPHNDNNDWQIVDLLQLSRREEESRRLCVEKIRDFHIWKKMHDSHDNSRTVLFGRIESLLRRKQVQDAILFYKLVRTHRIRAFKTYLEKLPSKRFLSGRAR